MKPMILMALGLLLVAGCTNKEAAERERTKQLFAKADEVSAKFERCVEPYHFKELAQDLKEELAKIEAMDLTLLQTKVLREYDSACTQMSFAQISLADNKLEEAAQYRATAQMHRQRARELMNGVTDPSS